MKWSLDIPSRPPKEAMVVHNILGLAILPLKHQKVKAVVNKDVEGVTAQCVESETKFTEDEYCVDPRDNTLLLQQHHFRQVSRFSSTVYRNYQKFGEHLFPRSVHYTGDEKIEVEIAISELVAEPSPEPSQFIPPSGAVETTNCLPGDLTPPRTKSAPNPTFPSNETDRSSVVLGLIVGADGRPFDIEVAKSGGIAFDAEAVRTAERWLFIPALCRDEPVPVAINIELEFQPR
jgi:TonB family protein